MNIRTDRKVWLLFLISEDVPKRRRKESRNIVERILSVKYYLPTEKNKLLVCRKFFLSTFCIGEKQLRNLRQNMELQKQMEEGSTVRRTKQRLPE